GREIAQSAAGSIVDLLGDGGVDAASIDQAMAKYMLVTCSAFVAYLIEEGRKAGRISEISVP
ncbi:hypothetical protein ACSFCF_10310, partial [Brevibacterium casei]